MKICTGLEHLETYLHEYQSIDMFGTDPLLTHIIVEQSLSKAQNQVILALPRMRDINTWLQSLDTSLFTQPIYVLPHPQLWGLERYQNLMQIRQQRLQSLYALANKKPGFFLTTWTALCKTTLPQEALRSETFLIQAGSSYPRSELKNTLNSLGYIETKAVHHPGQFLFRGAVLEVFPPHQFEPFRIMFFDEEVSSIQSFSVQTRQVDPHLFNECAISPAYERTKNLKSDGIQNIFDHLIKTKVPRAIRDGILLHLNDGTPFQGYEQYLPLLNTQTSTTFDYIDSDVLWIFPQSQTQCEKAHADLYTQLEEYYDQDQEEQKPAVHPRSHFLDCELQPKHSLHFQEIYTNPNRTQLHWLKPNPGIRPSIPLIEKNLESLWETLSWLDEQGGACLFYGEIDNLRRIQALLKNRNIPTAPLKSIEEFHSTKTTLPICTLETSLSHQSWVWLETEQKLIVSTDFLFGKALTQTKHHKKLSEYLTSLKELRLNDLVVHPKHGLGQYLGTHHFKTADGTAGDYVELMYQNEVRMYVPVEDLKSLSRYGNEGSARVDKIQGAGWTQRKSKAKKAIHDLAADLLSLQAKRTTSQPIRLSHSSEDLYKQFEDDFPWQETDDQLRSLQEIDHDLTSGLVMDRLLVGDVGFGKTEIAMRASMKTILSGFQVIILVPTTILCQQHERSFHHRMNHYGVSVMRLDRSVKTTEVQLVQKKFESGQCDVLISTHRILSKKWAMDKVGLVIIDEEQRFGVGHKEKLKLLRHNVHILSMTATPIPRTLHMSMIGLRQISLIETPPKNRRSVQTEIKPFSPDAIRDSIYRELDRNGQIFIIYNRVTDISRVRQELEKIAPGVSITVAHGQMTEASLDKAIADFLSHKTSILLCTTIVESGIDMPNVNTLIVYEAQRFGLSQLHQIRGRVGRSDIQAFALFLTTPPLSDDAQARLNSLLLHQELNAGFAIASQDLEQRGAGDLLGSKQSGHIGAIGLSLYTSMLEHAISELKGNAHEDDIEAELQIGVKPVIPRDYIETDLDRLKTYRRIFDATEFSQQQDLQKVVENEYGPMPHEIHQLFTLSRIRHQLSSIGVIRAKKIQQTQILLYFQKGRLQKTLQNVKPSPIYEVTNGGELRVHLTQNVELLQAFEDALMPLM